MIATVALFIVNSKENETVLSLTKLIAGGRIEYLWGRHNVEKPEIGGIIVGRGREIREWHIFLLYVAFCRGKNSILKTGKLINDQVNWFIKINVNVELTRCYQATTCEAYLLKPGTSQNQPKRPETGQNDPQKL